MNSFGGIYVPPGLFKNIPIRCSADNIDAKVDTTDGRNTFHGTAMAAYQRLPLDVSELETVCDPLTFQETSCTRLENIPSTVLEISECTITGNPKPNRSPRYENFKLGLFEEKVSTASQQDTVWLLSRFLQRHLEETPKGVPVWSAYNSRVSTSDQNQTKYVDQDHSLPISKAHPHAWGNTCYCS